MSAARGGPVRISAPAKVNLDLVVLGRRADGFHELSTTMVLAGLEDRLVLEAVRTQGVSCEVTGPQASEDVPVDARNLAVAALERGLAVLEATGPAPKGVHLRLEKEVPSGAGLGGGSSDAAAALAGLERLTGRDLGTVVRAAILADLGSDTVFFDAARRTGAGLCTGRGERVRAVPSPRDWWAALVTPRVAVPTGPVFAALEAPALSPSEATDTVAHDWHACTPREGRSLLRNDLEAAALRAVPALRAWRRVLDATAPGAFALSGSGSSFFAPCASKGEAEELLRGVDAGRGELGVRGLWAVPLGSAALELEAQS
jgi:4-diphosphocytidyl-2-C-methyl-D-erythritol kinase